MAPREIYKVQDVFTPTKPARATFVERESLNDRLVSALRTPGKQIVVYGHTGSGKTTLLANKLEQAYEDHITTRCYKGMTFEQLLLNAFDQLNPFYTTERTQSRKVNISSSVQSDYSIIKAQIGSQIAEESQTKQLRAIPPQLTPQVLARLLGEAKCCWVLEDFHKMSVEEKVNMSQVMKMFMDMSDIYRDLKIVAIGAVDTARQVIEYDPEMRNRISEIQVPLMSISELEAIVNIGEELLNFSIPSIVKQKIVEYSNGLASICHQLCLNICNAADVNTTQLETKKVTGEDLEHAIQLYLDDASDTFISAFNKAFRNSRGTSTSYGKTIIRSLLDFDQEGATHAELLPVIKRKDRNFSTSNLTNYLRMMQDEKKGSLIRYESSSGKYSFSDPFYRAFAMALMSKEGKSNIQPMDRSIDISSLYRDDMNFSDLFSVIISNAIESKYSIDKVNNKFKLLNVSILEESKGKEEP